MNPKLHISERNQVLLLLVITTVAFVVFGIYGLRSINRRRSENKEIRNTLSQDTTPRARRLAMSTVEQESFEEIRSEWREIREQAGFLHLYSQRHDPTLRREAKIRSIVEQMENRLNQWVSDGTIAELVSSTPMELIPTMDDEGGKTFFWEIPIQVEARVPYDKLGNLLQTCPAEPSPFVLRSIHMSMDGGTSTLVTVSARLSAIFFSRTTDE